MMVARVELSMSMPSEDKSLAQPVVTLVMMFEMLSLLHADWEQAPVNQLFIGWTREVLPAMARLTRLLALIHVPSSLVATLVNVD